MIRNVDDVTALLNRRFGMAAGKPWSIARTLIWVVLGLYLLGMMFPAKPVNINASYHNRHMGTTAVRDMTLDKNDPRGFAKPTCDSSTFTIAWIGTSTLQNVGSRYAFIPADVRKLLPEIDGKPVCVEMYLLEGGRMLDQYNLVSHAIATKPDMIMVDLNPLWVFNDAQTENWTNFRGAVFADMVGQPDSWPYIAAFDTPSDLALAAGSAHLSVLRDRWSYAQSLRDDIAKWSPLNPAKPKTSSKPLTGTALIASMQSPLDFWEKFRPLVPPGSSTEKLQTAMFLGQKPKSDTINDGILGGMFGALADSKIPSVAYLSAIDPQTFSTPGITSMLSTIEQELAAIADGHKAPSLLVQSNAVNSYVSGLGFKDMAHLTNDIPVVNYLAATLCTQLHKTKPNAACTPMKGN